MKFISQSFLKVSFSLFETLLLHLQLIKGNTIKIQKEPTEVSYKKGVLKNVTKFIGKQLCEILFFNKVAGRLQFTEHLCATAFENKAGLNLPLYISLDFTTFVIFYIF